MGKCWRRTVRGKKQKKYTIEWQVAPGKWKSKAYSPDKRASEAELLRMEKLVARRQHGLEDPYEDSRDRPVSEHVSDFVDYLRAGGSHRKRGKPSQNYIRLCKGRLRRMLDQARVLDDLSPTLLNSFFDSDPTMSDRTRDHHAALAHQFAEWLVDESRWSRNPFRKLGRHYTEASRTFVRRALGMTNGEYDKFVAAASVRPAQNYKEKHPHASTEKIASLEWEGVKRQVLYLTATFASGLRTGEVSKVPWGDVHLDESPRQITIHAAIAKSGQTEKAALPPWLGDLLGAYRDARVRELGRPLRASDPVFHVSTKIVELVEKDAVWAGLGRFDKTSFTDKKRHRYRYVDDQGRKLDFHAVSRVTLRTMLDRLKPGLSERLINMIMRHRPTGVGQVSYSRLDVEDMYEAVCRLPVPEVVGGVSAYVSAVFTPSEATQRTGWHSRAEVSEEQRHAT